MGASVSTAVANATQKTVDEIVNDQSQKAVSKNDNIIRNKIETDGGGINIDRLSNKIVSRTDFVAKLNAAVSSKMQSLTAQKVGQNVISELKNLNLLQAGVSVSDITSIINVAMDTFTTTDARCVSEVRNAIYNNIHARGRGDVNVGTIDNDIDSRNFAKCYDAATVDDNTKSDQLDVLDQRTAATVSGVDPAWLVGGAVFALAIVAAPVVIPVVAGSAVLKRYFPAIVLGATGVALIVYNYARKVHYLAIDGPNVLGDMRSSVRPLGGMGEDVMNEHSSEYDAFIVLDGKLNGLKTKRPLNIKRILNGYFHPPVIAQIGNDGRTITLSLMSSPKQPINVITLPENVSKATSVGVTLYTPTDSTTPITDADTPRHLVVLDRDGSFSMYVYESQKWTRYNMKDAMADERLRFIDQRANQEDYALKRYYVRQSVIWPTYVGGALIASSIASLLLSVNYNNNNNNMKR